MDNGMVLYLVIPCFNEELVIPEIAARLKSKIDALINDNIISGKSRIVFVDDGSVDLTWQIICGLHKHEPLFSGIKLSRNRGHQNALLAGLLTVKEMCDLTISMDADMQDDINSIDLFLEKFLEGNDIVYGIRRDRKADTTVKRGTAELFYKLLTRMKVEIMFNHADCRLMSRRALNSLSEFKEVNLFLRGIVPLIGFKSASITYSRSPRFAGESKYPFRKMFQLAVNGITSFSITPIRIITFSGIFLFLASFLVLSTVLLYSLMANPVQSFWWVILSVWLCCGLVMISLGIVGEYVGKAFEESKARPRFIVESLLFDQ